MELDKFQVILLVLACITVLELWWRVRVVRQEQLRKPRLRTGAEKSALLL